MSIITFWDDTREQSGKTLTSIAFATRLAIERNSKILLISTSLADSTINDCFWGNEIQKNLGFFNTRVDNVNLENGIEGLLKLVRSNKLEPSIITDYSKVVFKGRLEIITGFPGIKSRMWETNLEDFRKVEDCYIGLIKSANQYYDIVIVDIDPALSTKIKEEILKISEINVYVLSQRMESINRYKELRNKNEDLIRNRCVPVIGKYISKYKYNAKNIARYLGDKKEMDVIPLNLAYMEAAQEAKVVDLFLKFKNIKDQTDENYIFMQCTLNLTNNIMRKLQDMQMRMR